MLEPSSAAAPFISVLIPAFNEEALIGSAIDSVRRSFSNVQRTDYEVVVCDNNSTDRTSEVAQAKGARVVFEPHNQIARARNAAARNARGEWLLFLDGDTMLPAETLRGTFAAIDSARVGAGGALCAFDRPDTAHAAVKILRFWNTISKHLKVAAGSYIFCKREAWVEAGGFNETVYAGEELFFSRGLKRWCRKHRLEFVILTAPVVTSARKLDWYGPWELLRSVLPLACPGSIKRRENCGLWYTRPEGSQSAPVRTP